MKGPNAQSFGRRWHRRLDSASGGALLFLTVFTPWGAGGTLYWSSWVLIITGWLLGVLLLMKWALVWWTGFVPTVWKREGGNPVPVWPTRALAILTGLILLQVAVSLWNYRAEVSWTTDGVDFTYRDAIEWLPTTYDVAATRKALFRYLAFAGVFWALRDWLLIKSRSERHREEDGRDADDAGRVPDRVKWLGWVLSVNGAAMALVGILHRLDNATELLWMVSIPGRPNEGMFGSFPYRANASQYLNIIWPFTLGLWWALRLEALRSVERPNRSGGSPHPLLLLCGGLILVGIVVAASRGGIGIAALQILIALVILARSVADRRSRILFGSLVVGALLAGWLLAGDRLQARFANTFVDSTLSNRIPTYATARKIGADFPVWGSGAETYLTLNGLYRKPTGEDWQGYVHNDWLETRITFGWVGLGTICLMMITIVLMALQSAAVPLSREAVLLSVCGIGGALVHAFVDFPFQLPSICMLFVSAVATLAVLRTRSLDPARRPPFSTLIRPVPEASATPVGR